MKYRIVKNLSGENRWWSFEDTLPEGHVYLREATAEEAALIDEILAGNAVFDWARMDVGANKLRPLLARTWEEAEEARVALGENEPMTLKVGDKVRHELDDGSMGDATIVAIAMDHAWVYYMSIKLHRVQPLNRLVIK